MHWKVNESGGSENREVTIVRSRGTEATWHQTFLPTAH